MPSFGLLVHLFVPHTSNNHRSKALHVDSLFFYMLVFAVFNFVLSTMHTSMPDVLGYATDINVERLLADTNAERISQGLTPLTLNPQLSQAAAAKAQDMFTNNYWAHNSPAGRTPWDFISGAGYRYVVAGENLAKNFSTSDAVVAAWKASPTHWANIIKPSYREIGFAVVNGVLNGEETTLVVQMFGTSNAAVAVRTTPVPAPIVEKEAAAVVVNEQPSVAPVADQAVPAVVVTQQPEQPVITQQVAGTENQYTSVIKQPMINIPSFTRNIVFVFAGGLMAILLVDAWVVSRRKIVRIAGHNIAHFMFMAAIVIIASSVGRGSLI